MPFYLLFLNIATALTDLLLKSLLNMDYLKKTVIIPKGGSYKIHTSYPAWDSFQNLPKFLMFSTLHVCDHHTN